MFKPSDWTVRALILAACVALTAGWQPWLDAVSGAFVPADIAQDIAAAKLFVEGVNPYGTVIREAHAQLLNVPIEGTFPYFPHPPFSLIVSWPLAYLSYGTGAAVWFAFTLSLVFVLAALLVEIAWITWHRRLHRSTILLLLLSWPPILYNLEKGQWSVLLVVLVTLGWRSMAKGEQAGGAAWLGAAASVKVFPVLMGGYLLLRSRVAFGVFVATGLVLTALPLLHIGLGAFPAFIEQSQLNMPYWETYPSVTFSIHGALARLFIGGQWAVPAVHAPAFAWVIEAAIVLTLLAIAVWMTLLATRGKIDHSIPFAGWVAILPMLNPQSLGHNGALLALPLVLVWLHLVESGSAAQRVIWGAALALISLPKQTVWWLAPPPVEPWEGLLINAAPTWGAMLLFALVTSLAAEAPSRVSVSGRQPRPTSDDLQIAR